MAAVTSQVPYAGETVVKGSGVLLYTTNTSEDADNGGTEDAVTVPDVSGMTRIEAYDALTAVGLTLRIEPEDQSGKAIRQKPAAGETLPFGQSVTVEFSQVEE